MRLLILTQAVDTEDPVLGFFHRWIEELAKHFESIVVICLKKGAYDLPKNVQVYSLGKEAHDTHLSGFKKLVYRITYTIRFLRYIVRFRKNYDAVFVHMNQEYILLGGLLWKIFGKKIYLWRNHVYGNVLTRIACFLAYKIFYTSPLSFTARYTKAVMMPVGIDTDFFTKRHIRATSDKNRIVYIGRINPVKRIHVLIEALRILDEKDIACVCDIYGPYTHDAYYESLLDMGRELMNKHKLSFHGAISQDNVVDIYNMYTTSVNMTSLGSFDKTILEHMACEGIVLLSNDILDGISDVRTRQMLLWKEADPHSLAHALERMLLLHDDERERIGHMLRSWVVEKHSLKLLGNKLYEEFQS